MTWTRLSDDFTERPGFIEVSRSARLLHIEALNWANRHLTDGNIPAAALPRLSDATDLPDLMRELVTARLWDVDQDTGAVALDWSEQEPADRVKARRADRAEIQRRYRERGELHAKGDHRRCTANCPKQGQVTGNAIGLVTTSVTASRPDPSRPLGRGGKGTRAAAPSAGAPGAAREEYETPAPVTFSMPKGWKPKPKRSA